MSGAIGMNYGITLNILECESRMQCTGPGVCKRYIQLDCTPWPLLVKIEDKRKLDTVMCGDDSDFHQPVCNSTSELQLDLHVEFRVRVHGAVEELHGRRSRYEGASKVLQLAKVEDLF